MLNICTTCNSWEIGSYNTQQCLHMNICTFVPILSRKAQCNFPKMRGGVKGRFELFRKFIRFGIVRRPEVKHVTDRVRGGAYQWWRLWRLIQLEIWLTRRALVSKCGRLATRAAEECNSCCVHNLAKQTGRAACRVGMLRY